jgi:signal transduction histidine kinase
LTDGPGISAARPDGTALAWQISLSALCAFVVAVIWLSTGAGYFWPMWVWFGLLVALALHGRLRDVWAQRPGAARRLAVHRELSLISGGALVAIWALSGGGFFWPVFGVLGLGVAFTLHAWASPGPARELAGRVDELARTRRGALDVQAAELRRIERDLHDGAQARLVALSIQLGRAEERLADAPEAAELVRRARAEASAAIAELRDLARGIAPPVLADRGLEAAVRSLAERSTAEVAVVAQILERPPPVVETAAYFVVAEALTNAVKHAPGAPVEIELLQSGEQLLVEVTDHGPGGADPGGSGLTGLRQRVEALDGSLEVTGAEPHGTRVRALLRCE